MTLAATLAFSIASQPFRLNLPHRVLKEIPITRTTGKSLRDGAAHLLPDLSGFLVYGYVPEIEVYSLRGGQKASLFLYSESDTSLRIGTLATAFILRKSYPADVGSRNPSVVSSLKTFDGIHFWYTIALDSPGGSYEFGRATLEGNTWRIATTPKRRINPSTETRYSGAYVTGGIDSSGEHPVLLRFKWEPPEGVHPGQNPPMKSSAEFKIGTLASWGKYKPLRGWDKMEGSIAPYPKTVCEFSPQSNMLLYWGTVYDASTGKSIARTRGYNDAFFIDSGWKVLGSEYDPPVTRVLDIKSRTSMVVSNWCLVAHTANARYALFESPRSDQQVLVDLQPNEPTPAGLNSG